jgi:hypothetical protein
MWHQPAQRKKKWEIRERGVSKSEREGSGEGEREV